MEKRILTMKKEEPQLKDVSLDAICQILVAQYDVSVEQACQMINDSGIELFFDRDAEMAAHTSYRTWAQRVYEHSMCAISQSVLSRIPFAELRAEETAVSSAPISAEMRA